MSTLIYAALTAQRETARDEDADSGTSNAARMTGGYGDATSGTSSTRSSTELKSYVDVFAAMVPAEVLTAHAFILSFTTTTDKNSVTTITQPGTLKWVFFALLALSVFLYVVGHFKSWDKLDFLRMLIPPLAFVGWTMLEKTTAFDTVAPSMNPATRTAIAVIGAIALAVIATLLAFGADVKNTSAAPKETHRDNGKGPPVRGD